MAEAQCTVIGGHSIRNDDIQFGYAVTGTVNPHQIWRNVGAQPDDVLLLTKAIGTGVISTALKKERATKESVDAAIASMSQLNRVAADALHEIENHFSSHAIHAVTDVTGFGLLGHAREMALGNPGAGTPRVTFEIDHRTVPLLPGALDAARAGMIPGGLKNNRDFIGDCVEFAGDVPEEHRAILFDPQTSGGLFIALAPQAADSALDRLQARNVQAARIGRVQEKKGALLGVK
jgi:selenide,water dikinase